MSDTEQGLSLAQLQYCAKLKWRDVTIRVQQVMNPGVFFALFPRYDYDREVRNTLWMASFSLRQMEILQSQWAEHVQNNFFASYFMKSFDNVVMPKLWEKFPKETRGQPSLFVQIRDNKTPRNPGDRRPNL